MKDLKELEVWFAAGSQHLYGGDVLKKVDENSAVIAGALSASRDIPVRVVKKPVMTTSGDIHSLSGGANSSPGCIGFFSGCIPSPRPGCGYPGCGASGSRLCI